MQEEAGQAAIDAFISAFNASSDAYVTELLSQALTPDVVFWGPLGRSGGVEAVERFIIEMRGHPAGPGTMTRSSAVDAPGEWARYRWTYRTTDGAHELTGTDVVHLRDGRIDRMIVFAGELRAG